MVEYGGVEQYKYTLSLYILPANLLLNVKDGYGCFGLIARSLGFVRPRTGVDIGGKGFGGLYRRLFGFQG